jgi:thiopeptide-type bacteriocin biosynthesis protein
MIQADKFILRTPFSPFSPSELSSKFEQALTSPQFHEALILGSPSLYAEFIKDSENIDEDLRLSLFKYFLRMSYRCTPFGMFSGVSVGHIGKRNCIDLKPQAQYSKHTRIDNHFLNAFVQKILQDEKLKSSVLWFTNNTIYKSGDSLRYVEYRLSNVNRNHHLSTVENSDFLDAVLENAKHGSTLQELASILISDEISLEESMAYLNQVIESKLLLSELEPMVTGAEPFLVILKALKKYEVGIPYIEFLNSLIGEINKIDATGPGATPSLYQTAFKVIKEWDNAYDPKLALQSDLSKPIQIAELSEEVCDELKKTLAFLTLLNPPLTHPNLSAFIQEFSKRYENSEMSLLEVLDSESGIGYPVGSLANSDQSPLIKGLHFGNSNQDSAVEHKIHNWHKQLICLYQQCLESRASEIVVNPEMFSIDVDSFKDVNLPDSLYSMGSILLSEENRTNHDFLIDYRGSAGPSAANLLGRFCYTDRNVNQLVNDLIQREEQVCPDKIYAEVVHLAQARIGNVLIRPSHRKHEIPILTFASVDAEHTIPLADLMVSVRNGKIVLRSKRLNKEIVPRNTNAHNYSKDTIPYYHFLCDLQSQDTTSSMNWSWGVLEEFSFLPRVRYGKCILSKARWILKETDLKLPAKSGYSDFMTALQSFQVTNRLPDWLVLTQNDNQLPLDLKNETCLKIMWQELKRNKRLELEECIFNDYNLLVEGPEGKYTNEFIVPWTKLKNDKTEYSIENRKVSVCLQSQRWFVPGSEWHYVKIYCGVKTADKILTDAIAPLVDALLKRKVISQWFFIRYADPDNHLRIRFRGLGNFHSELLVALNGALSIFLKNNLVWKIQIDTYQRELERYGDSNIDSSEEFFFYDSIASLSILKLLDGDEGDNLRWQFAIKGVNDLLSDFGLSIEQKLKIMSILNKGFNKEFNAEDKQAQKQLSDHFRQHKSEVELLLKSEIEYGHEFYEVWGVFKKRNLDWAPTITKIKDYLQSENAEVSFYNLLESYIHMFLNRFIRSNQRMHELVIYDFLCRYYRSATAREKKLEKEKLSVSV